MQLKGLRWNIMLIRWSIYVCLAHRLMSGGVQLHRSACWLGTSWLDKTSYWSQKQSFQCTKVGRNSSLPKTLLDVRNNGGPGVCIESGKRNCTSLGIQSWSNLDRHHHTLHKFVCVNTWTKETRNDDGAQFREPGKKKKKVTAPMYKKYDGPS